MKFNVLTYKGEFVDELSLYNKKLSTQNYPDQFYSVNYTLQEKIDTVQQVLSMTNVCRDRDLDHINNLQMCEMSVVELKILPNE
jgi:hypothetical protein